MFKVIIQKLINNKIVDEDFAIVFSKDKASELVQLIRKRQKNQLCYYKEIK